MRKFYFRFWRLDSNTCDDGPEIETNCTIEADSWDQAVTQLKKELHDAYRERFFTMFMVQEGPGFFEPITVKGSLPGGDLLITDTYQAEFVRPKGIAP